MVATGLLGQFASIQLATDAWWERVSIRGRGGRIASSSIQVRSSLELRCRPPGTRPALCRVTYAPALGFSCALVLRCPGGRRGTAGRSGALDASGAGHHATLTGVVPRRPVTPSTLSGPMEYPEPTFRRSL